MLHAQTLRPTPVSPNFAWERFNKILSDGQFAEAAEIAVYSGEDSARDLFNLAVEKAVQALATVELGKITDNPLLISWLSHDQICRISGVVVLYGNVPECIC